jgi:predicted metal-dependent phosphoesterase TrpH
MKTNTTIQRSKDRIHQPFDLHMHSLCSDGGDTPTRVIEIAATQGVTLAALTDHDGVAGVGEAVETGKRVGVRVLPSIEMDTEWPHELHILGLDLDVCEANLQNALETARRRRVARNAEILRRLEAAGYDAARHMSRKVEVATRLHVALALVAGGYADSLHDAFKEYLRRGKPGYYTVERFTPQEVIALIRGAGGVPVWAHPTHGNPNLHSLAGKLESMGLMGIEAYHPSIAGGDSDTLVSIARQKGWIVTCGSDYHGANRPEVTIGQTWSEMPVLNECRAFFEARPVRG